MNPIRLWYAIGRFVLVDYRRLRRIERHPANGYGLSWDRLRAERTKRREPKSADALPCVR